jgi:putative spermidine/putrescine transport system ATP-binding protein
VNVLDRLDLLIDAGALITLRGPSGCGKTTLLRLIAGLVTPDEGSVSIAGVDVTRTPPHKRDVSVVFQKILVAIHVCKSEAVLLGGGAVCGPRRQDNA